MRKYNQTIKSICSEKDVYFIEIFEDWIKINYQELLKDGLHPNSEGHKKIFKVVKDFLIQNRIIEA